MGKTNRTPFKCKWSGCPSRFTNQIALDKHQNKHHTMCPNCFKWYIELSKHIAQLKRLGKTCTKLKDTAGTLIVY